ncbi:free fatty acid receptor 3-like [Protopterus annectens]|uniref:free fatty acid receptor 3-like n=1 Tax=Protopterus annectens TaxID=7888 RepID=UPI001CFACA27|nr:free fatty acid receptor 3-like [Protopterus annectens]
MPLGSQPQLFLAVYIITFVTGLPLNIVALYVFYKRLFKIPKPIDILFLNLTISDVIFLFFLPFKITEASSGMKWPLPYILCPISGFVFYSTIYISTVFLAAISIERYIAVAFPIQYKSVRRIRHTIIISVVLWILACGHLSFVYVVETVKTENQTIDTTMCYDNFTQKQLQIVLPVRFELFVVLFLVPLLITLFSYINLIWILYSSRQFKSKKKQRAMIMVALTLITFIVCFGPYNVSHIFGLVEQENPKWRGYALLLTTFNASLDPIMFYFSSRTVRNTLTSLFNLYRKRQGKEDIGEQMST